MSATIGTDALALRYGTNPHQGAARVRHGRWRALPFEVLNGAPGYINLLDALNGWQLVRELRAGARAARRRRRSSTSVRPARPSACRCRDALRRAYFVGDQELSPLAAAYARARGADRVSSYGDWVALSDASTCARRGCCAARCPTA